MSARAAGERSAAGGSRRRALAALCVTEIVPYGVIYSAFPVLAAQIAAGTGWSRTAVTAAYSAGNLPGALAGVPAGRLLQRHGPRPVMTASSVLGAASVAGIAAAPSYGWFLGAWLAAGAAAAGLFYPPAFAALIAGAVRGVFTLTEATLVADHWGPGRYAALNGVFSAPLLAAAALGPSIGAGIAAAGSYPALFIVLAAAGAALAAAVPSPPATDGGSGDSCQARRPAPDALS